MDNQKAKNSVQSFGIAGLVMGVFAILLAFIPCVGVIGILFGILSIIFGSISYSNAQSADMPKSLGLSGILLGGGAVLVAIFWLVFIVGAKDVWQEKFEFLDDWAQNEVNINIDEEFEDIESLDDLEAALDELESQLTDSLDGKEINVNVKVDVKDSDEDE